MNPRRTPGRIVADHAKNQFAQFPADASSDHGAAKSLNSLPYPLALQILWLSIALRKEDDLTFRYALC
jgi:hypothetical protein